MAFIWVVVFEGSDENVHYIQRFFFLLLFFSPHETILFNCELKILGIYIPVRSDHTTWSVEKHCACIILYIPGGKYISPFSL